MAGLSGKWDLLCSFRSQGALARLKSNASVALQNTVSCLRGRAWYGPMLLSIGMLPNWRPRYSNLEEKARLDGSSMIVDLVLHVHTVNDGPSIIYSSSSGSLVDATPQ